MEISLVINLCPDMIEEISKSCGYADRIALSSTCTILRNINKKYIESKYSIWGIINSINIRLDALECGADLLYRRRQPKRVCEKCRYNLILDNFSHKKLRKDNVRCKNCNRK